MNVLIVAEYLGDIRKPDTFNSRFLTVADMLVEKGHTVNIVTTNFIHHLKQHIGDVNKYKNCDVVTLFEPGYKKNVSIKRFYSHYILSRQLRKWLTKSKKPDVIYCAVPSLDFAYEAARYAKANHIKFVLDIQDLWPEAFEMIFNVPVFSNIIFAPFKKKANYIYSVADKIVAVSQTYVDRALKNNTKCKKGIVVYLGTDLSKFDKYKNKKMSVIKKEDEIWVAYAGTLGHSYDLKTIMDAILQLKEKSYYEKVKFIVMGDGPLKLEFEKYSNDNGVNSLFLGMLPYPEMVSVLCNADIVVNPIKKNSAGTIINKHADYAAAGLPVVNTQESKEYRELVNEWRMGCNCKCENYIEVSEKLSYFIENEQRRIEYGNNARKCAMQKFDRVNVYQDILLAIEEE